MPGRQGSRGKAGEKCGGTVRRTGKNTGNKKGKQYIGLYEEIRREPESSQEEETSRERETETVETGGAEALSPAEQEKMPGAADRFALDKKSSDHGSFRDWLFRHDPGRHSDFMAVRETKKWGKGKARTKAQASDQASVSLHSFSLNPTRTRSWDTRMGRFTSIPSVDKSSSCSSSVMDGSLSFRAMDL